MTKNRNELDAHITDNKSESLDCLASFQSSSRSSMNSSFQSDSGLVGTSLKCHLCNTFIIVSSFEAHRQEHYLKINKFNDDANEKSYRHRMNIREDEGDAKFSDPLCYFTTVIKIEPEEDCKPEIVNKALVCSQCNFYSNDPNDLNEHVCIMHAMYDKKVNINDAKISIDCVTYNDNGVKLFECYLCDKRFKTMSYLGKHLKRHNFKQLVYCSLCDFGTVDPSALKAHVRRHTGKKPYKCSSCKYKTDNSCNLERHVRTHSGEKPMSCPHCKYRSADASSLRTHVKRHQGKKPYTCPHCSYRCLERYGMIRHVMVHTGEKPFYCFVCDFIGIRFDKLLSHIKRHDGTLIKCAFCSYKTYKADCIVIHLKTKHKNSWNREPLQNQILNCNKSKMISKENQTTLRNEEKTL